MTDAEVKYITTEQEMLAIVYCFHQWRCYLQGTEVILHTDHEPLTWLQTQPRLSRRQARWMEFLSEFTYRPLHVPGEQNVVADALSRRLDLTAPDATCVQPVRADSIPAVNLISILPPNGFLGARIFLLRHSAPNAIFAIRKRPQIDANVPRKQTRQATRLQNEQRADPPRATATADTPTSTPCASLEPFRDDARPAEPDPPASAHRHEPADSPDSDADTPQGADLTTPKNFSTNYFPGAGIPSRRSRHQYATERSNLHLFDHRGLLWRTDPGQPDRLYIPNANDLRTDILYWHHDVPWAGHCGIERTLDRVQRQFFWPNMKADIKTYIESCTSCATNKTDRRRMIPPLNPLTPPESVWQTIGVDLITDLPPTDRKHTAIVVFKCHLTKCTRLVPGHADMNAKSFANLFFKEIFPHYGFPATIVSDRGSQWNNDFFRALCDQAGIKLRLSTAYHPQTNGLVERTNEVIEAALRHYVSADRSDWDLQLPFVEFALNSAHHTAIGTCPFALNRVVVQKIPLTCF